MNKLIKEFKSLGLEALGAGAAFIAFLIFGWHFVAGAFFGVFILRNIDMLTALVTDNIKF